MFCDELLIITQFNSSHNFKRKIKSCNYTNNEIFLKENCASSLFITEFSGEKWSYIIKKFPYFSRKLTSYEREKKIDCYKRY